MKLIPLFAVSTLVVSVGAWAEESADPAAGVVMPAFESVDTNADHVISAEEATGVPRLAEAFAQADRNQDGSLSKDEYLAVPKYSTGG